VSQTADRSFELIKAAYERNRLAHAFLISGALGSGKEQLASRLISLINKPSENTGMDLFGEPVEEKILPLDEQESSWVRVIRPRSKSRRIRIEEIRDLESTIHLAAPAGETKIGVIVDAHCMTEQAVNAFLKTLEEPPNNTLLLLLSSKPQRLLPTILSRCVHIKLIGGRSMDLDGGEELIAELNQVAKKGFGNPITALNLKAVFTDFLTAKKSEVEAAAKAAAKEESATYKDATDGTWLKAREDFHDAAAQADYLEARSRYLDVILAWLADIIRIKNNAEGLDFPESAPLLKSIAEKESTAKISKRLDALEKLRQTLETNASESIALEVGFLKTFG
jgi:DNA polymerase-3 subunit delta'